MISLKAISRKATIATSTRTTRRVIDSLDEESALEFVLILDTKDSHMRSPPAQESVGNGLQNSNFMRPQSHYQDNEEGHYEPSRSPRGGRGRYADRDQEGYRSPHNDTRRSASPNFGGFPSCTIILEGLPSQMSQEDVRRPVSILPIHTYSPLLS